MPWWIVAALAAVLLLAPWGIVRYARGSVRPGFPQAEVTVKKVKSLSRSELAAMLNRVKTGQPPKPRIGALCYETVTIYDKVEFVCLQCGEKTVYPRGREGDELAGLQELEREFGLFERRSPLTMGMEINGYCRHCGSGDKPRGATLAVTYQDGMTHSCFPFNLKDLNLLKALLAGKFLYDAGWDNAFSLKDEIPRLEQLLGVKPGGRT